MKRYSYFLVLTLLLGSRADAACVYVDNQDLIEYSCEAGSLEDLGAIASNAEKIRITHMPVGRITESLFSRFAGNLVVLTCSYCQISEIEDNAFRRLRSLQQLSLDNNHLTEVKGNWFEGLKDLTYLDLNYNSIERIDGDVFRNSPNLVDLRVSGNRLQCLDLKAMSKLKDLKRIFINENPSFGCPNAVRRFLNDRHVDFEADPQWNSLTEDLVLVKEPLPPLPASPLEPEFQDRPTTSPTTLPTSRWTEEPPSIPTMAETTPPSRRPFVPEMIQPSVPEQDFSYQGPYYAPKVTQQQLNNYRNTATQQIQNTTTEAVKNETADLAVSATTLPTVLVAGVQMQEPTTTECPNTAALFRHSPLMIMLLALTATMLFACRWTMQVL